MARIDSLLQRLGALRGWRRLLVAFAAGLLTVAALPPIYAIPALWIAFPMLLWLLDQCASWRCAALIGWAFGFGHFLGGLNWITNAFFVDAETFGPLALPALFFMVGGMSVFLAAVCGAIHVIPPLHADAMPDERTTRTAARALLFGAAWTLSEWVRNWIFTGFPWNPIATVWTETVTPIGLAMMQSASVVGTFGLSFLTVTAAGLAAVLGHAPRWRGAWTWALTPLVVLAIVGGVGAVRLSTTAEKFAPGVKLRLVQPNIPQADKLRPGFREKLLLDRVEMSLRDRPDDVTAVIWGEAAVTYFLNSDVAHRRVAALAAPAGGMLITGADRVESRETIFNSLYVITPENEVTAIYDKHHLVPFGEFMPWRAMVPFDTLTAGTDFSRGTGPATITVAGLPPFGPLICYEVIFPGQVTASTAPRPQWLLNLTNDSWFGTATGPYQHFATARLRTVEEGLPLVRVADTGISAVVDGQGRVVKSLGLGQRGVIDALLPTPVGLTPFALLGNVLPLLLVFATGWFAWYIYRRIP